MVDLITFVVLMVITYLLYDRLLRMVKVGRYGEKYVLVTGCDSGFGQRLAIRLDALGFNVFAGCLTEDGRVHLSQSCSKRMVPFPLDVRDSDSIQSAYDLVKQSLPKDTGLWGLVNNAGIAGNLAISELCTKKDYLSCWDVNLLGLIEMTRTFLPLIRKSRGRVVNTSSGLGRFAAFAPVYTLSMYGVEAYSDIVRREMYGFGVKVILMEPGAFKTSLYDVEKLTLGVQKSFDNATEEVQSVFKDCVSMFRQRMMEHPITTDIDIAVDAYIHALTSRFPRTRYAPGIDSLLMYILMSYLPTIITDWWLQHQHEIQPMKYSGVIYIEYKLL